MFKKIVLLISLYVFFIGAAHACQPRCWGGSSQINFEPDTVVGKAYVFGLEEYLAPNSDNKHGSDYYLYQMRDLMMFDFRLSRIASRTYQHLWPNININQFNAHLYSAALDGTIEAGIKFLDAVDGNMSDPAYFNQPVLSDSLVVKIQSVIDQNKGINASLDTLLHDMEKELGSTKGLKPVELMSHMNINTVVY